MAMLMTFTGRASAEDLAPAPPDRVWYRCCYNLISLYHNTRALPTLRSVLDLALALSPLDAPGTYNKISADLRMLRAQVRIQFLWSFRASSTWMPDPVQPDGQDLHRMNRWSLCYAALVHVDATGRCKKTSATPCSKNVLLFLDRINHPLPASCYCSGVCCCRGM